MSPNPLIAQLSGPAVALLTATVSGSVVAITAFTGYTAELVANASHARICAQSATVHFSEGRAADPTSTTGLHITDNQTPTWVYGPINVAGLRFIKESGGQDSVVSIMLYA